MLKPKYFKPAIITALYLLVKTTVPSFAVNHIYASLINTKDKTILLYMIQKIKVLNDEIKLLKAERELVMDTAKKSISKKDT